jgi:hypothetical protein
MITFEDLSAALPGELLSINPQSSFGRASLL